MVKESLAELPIYEEELKENPYINIIINQEFKAKTEMPYKNNKKIKILIADDDMFCIMAFKTLCISVHDLVYICEAYNGQQAIE